MLSRAAFTTLQKQMDDTIMCLVALARTDELGDCNLMAVADLMHEARRKLDDAVKTVAWIEKS